MNDLLTKTITIDSVEQTTTSTGKVRFKIKAEGLTYGLWKLKADGVESKAYEYLKTLGLDAGGRTVEIGYKEETKEYEGKQVTFRTIVAMKDGAEVNKQANPPVPSNNTLEARVAALETKVGVLWGKGGLNTPTGQNEPLEDLQGSMGGEIESGDIPF